MSNDESNVHKVYLLCKKEEEVTNKCVSAYLCRKPQEVSKQRKLKLREGKQGGGSPRVNVTSLSRSLT